MRRPGISFQKLETRNLLATVSFDSFTEELTFTGDVGVADIVSISADVPANTFEISLNFGAVSYTHLTLPTTPYV